MSDQPSSAFGMAWKLGKGFAKNAVQGLGAPRAIGVWTVLLVFGWVLPFVWPLLWLLGVLPVGTVGLVLMGVALVASTVAGLVVGQVGRQDPLAVLLRPVGVATTVLLQWVALAQHLMGQEQTWRGRSLAVEA